MIKAVVKIIKKVIKVIDKVITKVVTALPVELRIVAVVAISFYVPTLAANLGAFVGGAAGTVIAGKVGIGAIGGFLSGLVLTGSLKGALIGGLTGAALGYVGGRFGAKATQAIDQYGQSGLHAAGRISSGVFKGLTHLQAFTQSIAHGVINGLSSVLSGGKFAKAFVTGFVNKIASPFVQNGKQGFDIGNLARQTIFGGAVSQLVGGKFADGARFAFLATLFNQYGVSAQKVNPGFDGKTTFGVKDGQHYSATEMDLDSFPANIQNEITDARSDAQGNHHFGLHEEGFSVRSNGDIFRGTPTGECLPSTGCGVSLPMHVDTVNTYHYHPYGITTPSGRLNDLDAFSRSSGADYIFTDDKIIRFDLMDSPFQF